MRWLSLSQHLHVSPHPCSPLPLTRGHTGYSRGQTADAGSPRCLCRSSPGRAEWEKESQIPPSPTLPLCSLGRGPVQGSSAPWASEGLLSDWLVRLALRKPSSEKEESSSCPSPLPTHPPLAGQLQRAGRAMSVEASCPAQLSAAMNGSLPVLMWWARPLWSVQVLLNCIYFFLKLRYI